LSVAGKHCLSGGSRRSAHSRLQDIRLVGVSDIAGRDGCVGGELDVMSLDWIGGSLVAVTCELRSADQRLRSSSIA
jgi:hypothetical protein